MLKDSWWCGCFENMIVQQERGDGWKVSGERILFERLNFVVEMRVFVVERCLWSGCLGWSSRRYDEDRERLMGGLGLQRSDWK